MSELRKRLEAKKRRRATIPVQIDNPPAEVEQALEGAESALRVLAFSGKADDDPAVVAAQEARDVAQKALDAYFVGVEFLALPEDDFEALSATYRTSDDDEDSLDVKSLTAPLAAASAVDEDLHDEKWWAEQTRSWSYGERVALGAQLVGLNYSAPNRSIPKD